MNIVDYVYDECARQHVTNYGDFPSRFERWVCLAETAEVQDVEMIVKMFLDIHPFADGNGRTASILRNRMLGTLNDPTPLPFYYGST